MSPGFACPAISVHWVWVCAPVPLDPLERVSEETGELEGRSSRNVTRSAPVDTISGFSPELRIYIILDSRASRLRVCRDTGGAVLEEPWGIYIYIYIYNIYILRV